MRTINKNMEFVEVDSSIMGESSLFIETRFNLKLWRIDKTGEATRTKDWLIQRIELFETYCLPSVINQSWKDFCWIILFSDDTEDTIVQRVVRYKEMCPQLLPLFLNDEETSMHTTCVAQVINMFRKKESDVIIEVRLDNDDMFHKEYLKTIYAEGQKTPNRILSYKYGLQYFVNPKFLLGISYPHNHFIALARKNTDVDCSLIKIDHSKPSGFPYPIHYFTTPIYMWCEVVHGHNVGNDLWLSLYQRVIFKNRMLYEFGIGKKLNTTNTIKQYFLFYLPSLWSMSIKKIARKIKK